MAVQSITPAAHPGALTASRTGMTTLSATGAGNGFQFTYSEGYLCKFYNPTGSSATLTFKAGQPTAYSDRSMTLPDESGTLAAGADADWKPESIFKDSNGKVTIECDQLIEMKVYTQLTRS